jgi:hypothetical protein
MSGVLIDSSIHSVRAEDLSEQSPAGFAVELVAIVPAEPQPLLEVVRDLAEASQEESDTTGQGQVLLRPEDLNEQSPLDAVIELFGNGPPGPFPSGWGGWENVRLAHIHLLEKAIADCPPYPEGRFHDRGIVSCVSAKSGWSSGKNLPHGYFPGAWVLARELRRLGCELPITFAHLGSQEWDPSLTRLVAGMGVEVIDLEALARRDRMRILAGWETKVFAIEHAPYEEVLFLDADNLPIRNPSFLFGQAPYRETGAVFWPDLPPYDRPEWVPAVVWKNIGLDPQNTIDFESGQLLIDKRRCWKELRAARHINEHSDWYYQFIFGDKSTFHLAWAKCRTPWAMPEMPAGWAHPSILQHDFEGRLLFFHACQDKPSLQGHAHAHSLPNPSFYAEHLALLRRLWSGRLWNNDQPTISDQEISERLRGRLFEYERVGLDRRQMRFLEDDRIGRGAARCEFGWTVIDGNLAVTDCDGRLTFLAQEEAGGVWRGAWVVHERCEVVLTPLTKESSQSRKAPSDLPETTTCGSVS